MRETEIKLVVRPEEDVRARLQAAGFHERRPRVFEANLLLDTQDGLLRRARQVLRLRECAGEAILTFKGAPDFSARHKSREELETGVEDGAALLALLARLGYAPTYRYEKYRTEFGRAGQTGVVTLDETPIGVYLEIEGEAGWIDAVARQLGFAEADYITDSYASLYRRYCEAHSLPVGEGMVFGESPK